MRKSVKKFASLILIGFSFSAFAQNKENSKNSEVVKLSIEEAVDYALKNSRTLKSNDIDLEIKKRASSNSWNVFLPNVTASGTMKRESEISPQYASAGMTDFPDEESRWDVIGSVSASWNFTPAYIAQIKISKAQYEAGKISWEQNLRETTTNIKKAYYGLLLQKESLKIKKASLENTRQRRIQAQANFKNGSIPELQYLKAQVDYENAKPEVDTAEQALNQQMDLFEFLIGMPVGTKIELTSTIEPLYIDVTADELLEKYSDNDLQIKALEKNKLAAKLGITALDLSTWVPALSVSYGWQPMYVDGASMGLAKGNAKAFGFTGDIGKDEKWYNSGSLSLTLAWNITNMLPWSSNRQKVKDYKQQLAQLDLSLQTLRENQKVQVRKAVDTLNQAREQIESMARNVTLAQRAYDMTVRSYRNGTTERLDLRDTESSLDQAKLGLVNQKFQYISALMDLENTLNTNLTK
ncbi:MAG: TolC family protein [Treponema sp.]|uniref:TolC family protein n=1 Tax=Treponema sp. TaxID=166 RepID=UPI0025E42D3F|nr:TolC family protein [Treponema sp.]MBR0495670.1 TolC family protein [Treponema sp.]